MSTVKASKIVTKAKSFIGVKETPIQSNNIIFNTDYYKKEVNGFLYPWACVFIWDTFRLCNASELFYEEKKCAYCLELYRYYKEHNQIRAIPKVGDIVFYQFNNQNNINHVGIVIEVMSSNKIKTVEGIVSSLDEDDAGSVQLKIRSTRHVVGYARPDYCEEVTNDKK